MAEPAPLSWVVETWCDVRAASSRLRKRDRLAQLFASLEQPDELRLAALYLSGDVGQPPLGVGGALVSDALAAAPGGEPVGPPLTLREVDATFAAVAAVSGAGAISRRTELQARRGRDDARRDRCPRGVTGDPCRARRHLRRAPETRRSAHRPGRTLVAAAPVAVRDRTTPPRLAARLRLERHG